MEQPRKVLSFSTFLPVKAVLFRRRGVIQTLPCGQALSGLPCTSCLLPLTR